MRKELARTGSPRTACGGGALLGNSLCLGSRDPKPPPRLSALVRFLRCTRPAGARCYGQNEEEWPWNYVFWRIPLSSCAAQRGSAGSGTGAGMGLEGGRRQSSCRGEDIPQKTDNLSSLGIHAAEPLPGCGCRRAPKSGDPEKEKSQGEGHETPGGHSGLETQLPQRWKFTSCPPPPGGTRQEEDKQG